MAQSKKHHEMANPSTWFMQPAFSNPMTSMLTHMSGRVMEGFAAAQQDWADFAQRRMAENLRVARELAGSRSLAIAQEIYSRYLEIAFQQYREHSEKIAQRGERIAQQLTQSTNAKEASRPRY